MTATAPLFVIDDDPTGAQGQEDVPLLLTWPRPLLEQALSTRPRAIHLLTNSRALEPEAAYEIVRDAGRTIGSAMPASCTVLRGDSTLRGHLLPEYRGLCDGLGLTGAPPLLLVPALPAAGRVTAGGRHWLVAAGARVPIAQTPFAADATFGYRSSRLLDWADERSAGYFPAAHGTELNRDVVDGPHGPDDVADALLEAVARGRPSVVAPDAETEHDLQVIAEGVRRAWRRDRAIVVRCAPAFASVLSGAGATAAAPLPAVGRGVLVVVGSHVAATSAQLAELELRHPDAIVEVDPRALAGADGAAAAADAVGRAADLLARTRLAVVATAREVPADSGLDEGMRIACALAGIVERLRDASDVLLSKGGITSAVNVRVGLHADWARVVGPVAPGVSLWHVRTDGAAPRPVIVFPGNVGNVPDLADLVDRLLET